MFMMSLVLLLVMLDMTLAFWYSATRFSKKFLWCKRVNSECVRVCSWLDVFE